MIKDPISQLVAQCLNRVAILVVLAFATKTNLSAAEREAARVRNFVAERAEIEASWHLLEKKWGDWAASPGVGRAPKPTVRALIPSGGVVSTNSELELPPPQRRSLVVNSLSGYREPAVLRSADGTLTAVLVATYGRNLIGNDPVYLRSYNGEVVGPTLRARPGDVLRITVRNNLPTQPWKANSMNKLHDFDVTNLHFHGLHVSPNGISDNVLIEIGPGASQDYVVEIPPDHPSGTYWYHPHHHGSTAANVASGMSGALIIEGGLDDLPEIKAAKERVMVLNQILYLNRIPSTNASQPDLILPEGIIEEKYAGDNFGPGDAAKLGRFTTINGIQLPVIRMRPGEIERWRLVDSAQSEILALQLVSAGDASITIPFHEIAVDGLARGKAVKTNLIQMLPGYRSDVLVKIDAPGEYLLVDQAKLGMKAEAVPLQYVARVIVEGKPVAGMRMPSDEAMARFRLPTLVDARNVGKQSAVFAITAIPRAPDGSGGGARFTIDNTSFDMDKARELKLGTVDEWTVRALNGVIPTTTNRINTGHPFHIHVNPFEVTSIKGPEDPRNPASPQREFLTDGPVWRDTIWVPNNGTVKFRTKYQDFIGTFVQHCHILDHEDQGMMELVDIYDPAKTGARVEPKLRGPGPGSVAPEIRLPDANGRQHSLKADGGRRTVVFFFKGHGCLHCARQVQEFSSLHAQFKARDIDLIGITSDTMETLEAAIAKAPCPFRILADPEARAFAAYGCSQPGGLAHGTFLIGTNGRVEWCTIGANPFLDVARLLEGPPLASATGLVSP